MKKSGIWVGAEFSIACNSATSALHMACLALGCGEGDLVWTSPISFVASANCAIYCGASVDFVDVNVKTGNISVSKLEVKLKQAAKLGVTPKALIVVHLGGFPCDLREIFELSELYGFDIIEDASHALGAKYYDAKIAAANIQPFQYSAFTR